MSQRQERKRFRLSIQRLSAQQGSPLALSLWYIEKYPIDAKEVISDYLRHAFFVRSLRALRAFEDKQEIPGMATSEQLQFLRDQSFAKSEAWKSIWFFWGLIESVCSAANIPAAEILDRLGAETQSGTKDLKVSELASLIEDQLDGVEEENDMPEKESIEDEKQRISSISSRFGA